MEQTQQYTYTFAGWLPGITAVLEDATYKAQFNETIREYTISFDANGGSGSMTSVEEAYNQTYILPTCTMTPPENKQFKCWIVNGTEKQVGEEITITANTTVKAVWEYAPYTPPKEDITNTENQHSVTVDKEIAKNNGINATDIFSDAKTENKEVEVKVDNLSIVFNNNAVTSIGGNNITLKINTVTDDNEITVENAKLVIEISLDGATFTEGKATLECAFTEEIPEGKIAKVYYIDNLGNKTNMNATFENGKVKFETNHFSTYVVVFEDTTDEVQNNGLSTGMIIGISCGLLVIVCVIICFVYMRHKKRYN